MKGLRSWWPLWGFGPCWMCGAVRQGYHEGKRASWMWSRLVCSHHPSALHQPACNLSADVQKIAQSDRIHKGNSCKWCSWTEEWEESWWPSLATGSVCWPAASTVRGKLSTGVHILSDLINSAAHKATCLINSNLCLWTQGVSWIFYFCCTWCGSWGSSSETIILPFPC